MTQSHAEDDAVNGIFSLGSQIPPPPPSAQFSSLDDLVKSLQDFYRKNGAALVKKSPGNYREIHGVRQPTYIQLRCDRGDARECEAAGVRKSSTQKVDCPFKITASATQKLNYLWTYRVAVSDHNHGPSLDPSAHVMHRRRTPEQLEVERSLFKHKSLPAREMSDIIRDVTIEPSFFRQKDIYNDRQKLRQASLGGKTATQAWIGSLQDQGLKHLVRYSADRKVEAVFWTYPWCELMWKRFPEVLGMDNTYKTNRFKMYLFQVTGVTDQKSVANFGFGLINSEKEEGFQWLCDQVDDFRRFLGIRVPSVVITDKEIALKNALYVTFPDTQQQLCVFHINANIKAKIAARWKDPKDADADEDTDDDDDDDDCMPTPSLSDRHHEALYREANEGTYGNRDSASPAPPPSTQGELTRETMFSAWHRVIYADQVSDFKAAWASMNDAYNPQQKSILRYISREYMPWREQWAKCYICRYRNFGQRVNSPVETAHKDVKSFLVTGTGDLLHLHKAIQQMLKKKQRDYEQQAARMMMRQRREYMGREWLGKVPLQITYAAVDLLVKQHRFAEAAFLSLTQPTPEPLRPCSGNFTQQYGLPCSHYIYDLLVTKEPLLKEVILPRWWLHKPLDLEEPLLLIRDPDVVANLRGRPRIPVNKKLTIPSYLQASVTSSPQQQTQSQQTPRQPRQNPQTTRRLNPSVRRTLSQTELVDTPSSQQSRKLSTPRSRGHTNTRGRGSRGGRGRGRGAGAVAAAPARSQSSASSAVEDVIIIPATQPEYYSDR